MGQRVGPREERVKHSQSLCLEHMPVDSPLSWDLTPGLRMV